MSFIIRCLIAVPSFTIGLYKLDYQNPLVLSIGTRTSKNPLGKGYGPSMEGNFSCKDPTKGGGGVLGQQRELCSVPSRLMAKLTKKSA
jgi:hypothetical protein